MSELTDFQKMLVTHNGSTFCNPAEFGRHRTVEYDGETYKNVRCVITKSQAKDRATASVDHTQGIYLVTAKFHCPLEDLDGIVPEKGGRIDISDDTGFMRRYYVALSACEENMVRLDLEGIDE